MGLLSSDAKAGLIQEAFIKTRGNVSYRPDSRIGESRSLSPESSRLCDPTLHYCLSGNITL